MRVVADTNVVVSGLLWQGPSRQLLNAARQGTLELFTSGALLAELEEVLQREKFIQRLTAAQVLPRDLVTGFAALATIVQPAHVARVVIRDPDDDEVIACAVTAAAANIVSGDRDLLALKRHHEIEIVRVAEFIARIRQD